MSEGIRGLSYFRKFAHTHWVRNSVISCYYHILLYSAKQPSLKIGSSCREARGTGWVFSLLYTGTWQCCLCWLQCCRSFLHPQQSSSTLREPCAITCLSWVWNARKDFFSDMQCHVQKIDWNPNRTASFSFLLPNFESIGGFIAGSVLPIVLYHTHAETWLIFMLQKSWLNKEKNPCLDICWISYLPFLAYKGILMDRWNNLLLRARPGF